MILLPKLKILKEKKLILNIMYNKDVLTEEATSTLFSIVDNA